VNPGITLVTAHRQRLHYIPQSQKRIAGDPIPVIWDTASLYSSTHPSRVVLCFVYCPSENVYCHGSMINATARYDNPPGSPTAARKPTAKHSGSSGTTTKDATGARGAGVSSSLVSCVGENPGLTSDIDLMLIWDLPPLVSSSARSSLPRLHSLQVAADLFLIHADEFRRMAHPRRTVVRTARPG